MYLLQEHLTLIRNDITHLGDGLAKLPALRTLNCRYNKLSDDGIPGEIFSLEDLSVVVCCTRTYICTFVSFVLI